MTQRELVVGVVRLAGAYLIWENSIALFTECAMPSGTIVNVPGITGQVVVQIVALLFGIYLLLSGRLLVELVCRPE